MDLRQHALKQWLNEKSQLTAYQLEPLPADASFRRYFRVYHPQGSYILMDAPPEKENCVPYVAIANALRKEGLHTPEIITGDVSQGFLLMTDFGNKLYLN